MTKGTITTNLIRRLNGTVATVTISRPSKLNSLNSHLLTQLPHTLQTLSQTHPDLLAIILTGEGRKSFIGGADIAEMATLDSPPAARKFITQVHRACTSIRDCPVPVIGRINGYALGAGLEIAASCDFRVASSNAEFGMPEVRIGIPSVVEAALLPGLIGWGRTRRLLMLAENISAKEALRWGLVEKVVEFGNGLVALDEAVEGWIQALEKNGPLAVRNQKRLMRRWEQLGLEQGIVEGIAAFGEAFESETGGQPEPLRMMAEFFKFREKKASKL